MEDFFSGILSIVIDNDKWVLLFLVFSIAATLFVLLLLNFSAPESVVLSEYGSSDEFEHTLRKVLADTEVKGVARTHNALEEYQLEQMSGRLEKLEDEVLTKDKTIADLNKRLTAAGSGTTVDGVMQADANELHEKIKDLQARLHEYEIIEDDIADLSRFKDENSELKEEIDKLRAKLASMATGSGGEKEPALNIVKKESSKGAGNDTGLQSSDFPELEEPSGADLVAEFEKVVNNQEAGQFGGDEPQIDASKAIKDDGSVTGDTDVDYGEIMVSKLQEMNIAPDSKEEADLLISDLRSLKLSDSDIDQLAQEAEATPEQTENEAIKEDNDADKKDVS